MSGKVLLVNPRNRTKLPEHLKKYDVFGWRAVITGTPYCYSALANSKVSLWVVPKRVIDILNLNSEESRTEVYNSFKSENILQYLQQDQGLDRAKSRRMAASGKLQSARTWSDTASHESASKKTDLSQ